MSYKIAAKNQWGTGKFSRPNLEIDVAQAPDQIDKVTINDSGMVRLSWDDPSQSGGSVIDKYEVEIKNSAGEWVTPTNSCKNDSTDANGDTREGDIKAANDANGEPIHLCRIEMLSMQDEFGLQYNDSIVARVRAVNAAGL